MKKFILGLALLLVGSIASAATVTINWKAPTTCSDGSALTNCATTGYEIQERDAAGIWAVKEGVGAAVLTKTYTNVAPGEHCFRLRTNAGGTFSAVSNEACITVPKVAPNAPVITVTISVAP